jgi:phage anti-repressor protein
MKTDTSQSNQPSNTTLQVFKPEMSKLLDLTSSMIKSGEIKTDIEFAKKFMFSFDSEDKYPINLELLVDMNVYELKHKAKEALLKTFTEQVDFKIEKATHPNGLVVKKKGGSGLLKENIFLTTECFKTMCMLVRNEMGRQTQKYYIDLEKVFKTYVMQEFQDKQIELDKKTKENTRLLKLHNQMTQKHQYYKFKTKGPVFYIIISGLEYKDNIIRVKIGIAGCQSTKVKNCPNCDYCFQNKDESDSLDSRLANHRTLWPQLQVKFVVFTPDASLLEKCIKREFRDKINPHGHELVYNVEPEKIILETMKYLNMFNLYNKDKEYLIANDIEEYNVNALSHMKSIDNEFSKKCEDITEFTESLNSFEPNKIGIFNIEDENKVDLVDKKDEEENDTEIDNEENKNIKQFFIVICKRIFAYISNLFTI